MATSLTVLPEAAEDIVSAARWYDSQRAGLGLELLGALDAAFARIREHPTLYPFTELAPRHRKAALTRFPYVVIYELRPDEVEVVAVAHTRRFPGFWVSRVKM